MNLIAVVILLMIGFFVIGFVAAISEQHKMHEEASNDAEDDCLNDQTTIVISQEVPSVFDAFSSKK